MLRYRPAAPLDRYVKYFWWTKRSEPLGFCEYALPSGCAQLVITLYDDTLEFRGAEARAWTTWSKMIVHGPQQRHYIVAPKPAGEALGVAFRPGRAGEVLGVATAELVDTHVCLEALWGGPAVHLRERLLAAPGPHVMFDVLEACLTARIETPLSMHPAVALALDEFDHTRRISQLYDRTGYSPRYFIAKFNQAVGLTPKQFLRIRRFNHTARSLASGSSGSLADLAAALGYSDQSHLTREFREFAGLSPTTYTGLPQSPLHHRVRPGAAQSR